MEDFNEGQIKVEDKQSAFCRSEFCAVCGGSEGLMECLVCELKFCNDIHDDISDIMFHIKNALHYMFKIRTKPNKYENLKCFKCDQNDIRCLHLLVNEGNNEIKTNDIMQTIFCEKHAPSGCEPLISSQNETKTNEKLIGSDNNKKKNNEEVDIKEIRDNKELMGELRDIAYRKFNKVKKTYESKEDYYRIYKPLIVADYSFTKDIYEDKEEYDIELLSKKERYYFKIPEEFREMNLFPGRVLGFKEVENYNHECITFLAVINKMTYEEKDICYVWIMPINKHIKSLRGHQGKYKIKEEMCSIPFTRMMEALDLFVSDESENQYDGAVAPYLTKRILGQYQYIENNDDFESNKYSSKPSIEEKALKRLFVEKPKIVTNLENYQELNYNQIVAIESVFHRVLNLIQGPPGTGKTFLLSYIVYNIFKLRKNKKNKILLCSPSNSATDNIALSLLKLNTAIGGEMKICRVYSKSREFIDIPDDLFYNSLHGMLMDSFEVDNAYDLYENKKEDIQEEINYIINDMDIVIATCSTTWDERIKSFDFPFVIIDEVTQCCEIEALIPIVHGCKHLTLIGDQKQLGPVILHPQAEKIGMKVSLFERMLKLYPNLLDLLNTQYRMHEEIVKFPNKEFYSNGIQNDPSVGELINEKFNAEFKWPNKNIPLLFVDIEGKEHRTKFKSKQNQEEANIVVLLVKKLKKLKIEFENMGIITPYIAQKILIQKKLRKVFDPKEVMTKLHISSVDGFQGREKDFIIVSNVRSNPRGNIGFLDDFRRLNVSITRAKYGMIVIGNVDCLTKKSNIWGKFINYYYSNGLLVDPEIKSKSGNNEETIEFKLTKKKFETEKDEDDKPISYQEYDFDDSKNDPNINQDLLDDFRLTENVYAKGNKRYLIKNDEYKNKKNKNKKKKKQQYYY